MQSLAIRYIGGGVYPISLYRRCFHCHSVRSECAWSKLISITFRCIKLLMVLANLLGSCAFNEVMLWQNQGPDNVVMPVLTTPRERDQILTCALTQTSQTARGGAGTLVPWKDFHYRSTTGCTIIIGFLNFWFIQRRGCTEGKENLSRMMSDMFLMPSSSDTFCGSLVECEHRKANYSIAILISMIWAIQSSRLKLSRRPKARE